MDKDRQVGPRQEWGFISNFHGQYREIEDIFKRYWHVLCKDRTLIQALLAKPSFIYRKAHNFCDRVVKKVLDPLTRPSMFWDRAGFYSCRRCNTCSQVNSLIRGLTAFTSTGNNRTFKIKEFITCSTTHIFVQQCTCNLM